MLLSRDGGTAIRQLSGSHSQAGCRDFHLQRMSETPEAGLALADKSGDVCAEPGR